MDIELAQLKEQTLVRQEELKALIYQKKETLKEQLAQNDSYIELMNIELQNLRLEFVQEEIRQPPAPQLGLIGTKYACCDCLVVSQTLPHQTDASIKTYADLLLVKDTTDFYRKLDDITTRNAEMGYCGVDCCHSMTQWIVLDVQDFFTECATMAIFFFAGVFLLYILMILLCMPFSLGYNCVRWLAHCCYRRNKRTNRIYQIYKKYDQLLNQIYLN